MKNSIQYFTEKGIPELEKIEINFMETPAMFDKCVKEVLQVLLRFACCLICEWLEECIANDINIFYLLSKYSLVK